MRRRFRRVNSAAATNRPLNKCDEKMKYRDESAYCRPRGRCYRFSVNLLAKPVYIALILIFLTACMDSFGQTTQPITASQEAGTTVWKLHTASSLYEIGLASDGIVVPLYYGPSDGPTSVPTDRLTVSAKIGSTMREVPFRGGLGEQVPAIEVVYPDGVRDADLVYDSSSLAQIEGQPGLRINLKDPA